MRENCEQNDSVAVDGLLDGIIKSVPEGTPEGRFKVALIDLHVDV